MITARCSLSRAHKAPSASARTAAASSAVTARSPAAAAGTTIITVATATTTAAGGPSVTAEGRSATITSTSESGWVLTGAGMAMGTIAAIHDVFING